AACLSSGNSETFTAPSTISHLPGLPTQPLSIAVPEKSSLKRTLPRASKRTSPAKRKGAAARRAPVRRSGLTFIDKGNLIPSCKATAVNRFVICCSVMTRRTCLLAFSTLLARAADRLPANKNVQWALGSNLWNSFPRVPFTDILDIMRDTGFIGVRVTQFPQILTTYNITAAELEKEVSKRNLHVITISFNGPAHDPARRAEVIANAKKAMGFLKGFGASRLVVFSPSRAGGVSDEKFKTMCECYNQLGEVAGEMGFRAGLHNHLGQMVQDTAEVDRCMAMTDPKLFSFSPDTAHLFLAKVPV